MSAPLHERSVRVLNRQGLHARPADLLVRCASEFQSQIFLQKGSEKVDCRSILSLLTLGATEGTDLTVSAQGQDAEQALEAVARLFDLGFHELDETTGSPACSAGGTSDSPDQSPS
ncbi:MULTISPECIES: HPr family phosphocarrier protein [Rhodopirellula]|uniref:HPr family phosphocarrier protein n=1 Tax=Rhodopirellula TaxID=265488 RepID=UPI00064A378D|nr:MULTISPECIES: HPr family phosphocarrier protein [Rhodopirellula]WDQ18202.1 HPr family phosphocarrier protein [Rhodopirellula sp. P2]